jgi:hypothetical protein
MKISNSLGSLVFLVEAKTNFVPFRENINIGKLSNRPRGNPLQACPIDI